MKYSLLTLTAALLALTLTACGEPKPGQYPPSQDILKDREGAVQESPREDAGSSSY